MSGGEVTKFLDEHLRARIGTRLIAEQHIALHNSSIPHDTNSSPSSAPGGELYIGIIDTKLSPRRTILSCAEHVSSICDLKYGVRPSLVIDGQPETTFAHVPVHLEYIVTELLKNAFRATVESGREGGGERAEVVVTIAKAPDEDDGDLSATGVAEGDAVSNNKKSTSPGITIRIRDRGGGIHPDHLPNIWSYSFTTYNGDDLPPSSSSPYSSSSSSATSSSTLPSSTSSVTASSFPISSLSNLANLASTNSSSIAGLGYGLPLSRAYAEYFGGSIGVQSMWGWGTDVYLNLKGVGRGVL
ncbi:MAG: hypothetical protein M1817_003220 [Caeruleum heppii]|nr:MAG: hypothetical protein M1817_003220 [Caeruleum heppii]